MPTRFHAARMSAVMNDVPTVLGCFILLSNTPLAAQLVSETLSGDLDM
jgi:hypothetical protein